MKNKGRSEEILKVYSLIAVANETAKTSSTSVRALIFTGFCVSFLQDPEPGVLDPDTTFRDLSNALLALFKKSTDLNYHKIYSHL